MKKITFIIPVYRNEQSLAILFKKIVTLFEHDLANYDYQVVFIDDGSDDGSLNELLKLKSEFDKIKIISFSRNFGQRAAHTAGYRNSEGDLYINLSADLQEPIELIPQMVKEWENGNEIVICYKVKRNDKFIVNLTSKIFYTLIRVSLPQMPDGGFDFILLDKKVVDEYNKLKQRNRYYQGEILGLGYNVKFIPSERLERKHGKSQWSFSKRFSYFIDAILNTAYWPIRLMSFLGFLFAFLGFIYAIVVVYARIVNETPFKGYAPIVILLLIIGGLIMLMLGVIGEYVWRIFDETKQRPEYIIKEKYE